MRIAGRKYRDEWIPNYYPSRVIENWRLRVSRAGRMLLLSPDEDAQLEEIFMDQELFERLEKTGHIVTAQNAAQVFSKLAKWQEKTYQGPALHIVVVSKRCNLDCSYCHMYPEAVGTPREAFDLQPDVAEKIAEFIVSTPNPYCQIEFQGGEPFLNFEGIVKIVEAAESFNKQSGNKKRLGFSVVSNLLVATDEQLQYCVDKNINVSYTLNGTREVHDRYRITRSGKGSYDAVIAKIEHIEESFPGLLSTSPLCTVGDESFDELREIVDFFHDYGFDGITVQKLKPLGNAVVRGLSFNFERYLDHYIRLLDYMFEKNKTSAPPYYNERTLRVILSKILCETDVGFVDWRNPCGDVTMALTYDFDGEILPSDEARSLREQFTLGNVRNTTYDELIRRKETFRTTNISLRDREPVCRECSYNPYCGVLPVLEFAGTGDPVPRPHESEDCRFTIAMLDWTFRKYIENPITLLKMLPDADRLFAALASQTGKPPSDLQQEHS